MTIIDDVKKKAEDGLKALRETAEEIASSVEKQARIARKKLDVGSIQRRMRGVAAAIGEYVHGEFTVDRVITYESSFLRERLLAMSEMKAQIREIEKEIEKIRGSQSVNSEPPVGE
jgi:hypothetical protein